MSDAIAEYMQDRAADGLRPISLVTIEARLRTMFECHGDRTGGLLAEVTPSRARVLLDALAVRHVTAAAHGRRPAREPRRLDVDGQPLGVQLRRLDQRQGEFKTLGQ